MMKSTEYLTRAIWIVIKQNTPAVINAKNALDMHNSAFKIDALEEEMLKATGHHMSDYFFFKKNQLVQFL